MLNLSNFSPWRDWPVVRPLAHAPWARVTAALLRQSIVEFRADHGQQMAAAISFHVLFSVFPLAIAVVGAIGLVTQDPHARDAVIRAALGAVPLSSTGRQDLRRLIVSVSGGAGALGLLGLLGVLWSASGVMAAIRTALNVAWDTTQKRPFLRGKLVDLMLVAGIFAVIAATFALAIAAGLVRQGATRLPHALQGLAPVTTVAASAAVFLISAVLLFLTFGLLYRFVPAVPTQVRGVWPGALAAAAGLEAVQYGFSIYVSHFAHYNRVYGTLGTVVAFLFFVYLASMVFIFGAEVASEYPRLRREIPRGGSPRHPERQARQEAVRPETMQGQPRPSRSRRTRMSSAIRKITMKNSRMIR